MKIFRVTTFLIIVAVAMLLNGCVVTQLDANVTPGAKLADVGKIYVVHRDKDERGIDRLIAERLNLMGHQATFGAKSQMPADAAAYVTYQDKWMWDITMYMIELNVQLRKTQSDIAFATGHSFRTSLGRKSPAEMVEEVLTEISKKD